MPTQKRSTAANTRSTIYKVFVSSTFLDNQDRRKVVEEAITMAEMLWHGMEIFTASTRPTVEECLRYVKEADLLVGIIAWRYGWEPEGKTSMTEMEYDAATERLMFLLDDSLPVRPDTDFDPGPDRWKKQEKLAAFKAKISRHQMPTSFTETTLGAKVLQALHDWRTRRELNDGRAWIDEPRGAARVVRGGSWGFDAPGCRAACRYLIPPGSCATYLGFRLARSVTLGS
jgi:hypothetical protein